MIVYKSLTVMIDLSKAKLFDCFRTFNGDVLQLTAIMPERDSIWKYILSNDKTYDTYTVNGEITPGLRSGKDLEAQIYNRVKEYPFLRINYFCKQHHADVLAKGFTEKQPIATKLMLIVSELSEALEADCRNKHADFDRFGKVYDCGMKDLKDIDSQNKEAAAYAAAFRCSIKDTFEDEIADAFLRLMDLCGEYNIDIDTHIILKSAYNRLRPAKHGKEY